MWYNTSKKGRCILKKISEIIELLKSAQEKYGDLPVVVWNAVESCDYADSVELIVEPKRKLAEHERIQDKKFVVIN